MGDKDAHSLLDCCARISWKNSTAALVIARVSLSTTLVWNTTFVGDTTHISVRKVSPGKTCFAKRPCIGMQTITTSAALAANIFALQKTLQKHSRGAP